MKVNVSETEQNKSQYASFFPSSVGNFKTVGPLSISKIQSQQGCDHKIYCYDDLFGLSECHNKDIYHSSGRQYVFLSAHTVPAHKQFQTIY